jgi:hypothetical protein
MFEGSEILISREERLWGEEKRASGGSTPLATVGGQRRVEVGQTL